MFALSLGFLPPPSCLPPHAVGVRAGMRAPAVVMNVRSSWAAMDDGAPLGLLEKDGEIVFSMLDEDGSGSITRAEMSARLLACGYTEERVEKVFGKIDSNGDGEISTEEWKAAYIKYPTLRTAPGLGGSLKERLCEDADSVFASLDEDESGTISEAEIRQHLEGCGYEEGFATTVLKVLDFDKSGEVDQEEFRSAFLKHPSMRSAPGLGGGVCDPLKE